MMAMTLMSSYPSFPRKREPSGPGFLRRVWTPAFAGATDVAV
jgi:hypothetical protein